MQFTSVAAAALLASLTLASPLKRDSWTIQSFTRTCNDSANSCHYAYSINTNDGTPATGCAYDIAGTSLTSAREQSYNLNCGAFTIGSNWSGQFGAGQGFSALSVVKGGLIVFPAYSDSELQDGVAVSPDKSYTPQSTTFAKNVVVSN